MRRDRRLLLASLVALFAGCSLGTHPNERHLDAVRTHRAIWESNGIGDYRYTLVIHSMVLGGRPFIVEVIDGVAASVVYGDTEQGLSGTDAMAVARFDTVDELFDVIESQVLAEADQLSATYDGIIGHPTTADFDPDQSAIDDEFAFLVSHFQEIPAR